MIIGNGLIAKAFHKLDHPETLIFASGVSNSLEINASAYTREFNLLKECISNYPQKKIIYFSTLSIFDKSKQSSPYVIHKKEIENYIQNYCKHFLILRIGNIVGHGGNPNTLFNFLAEKIDTGSPFQVHTNARRLIIDIDDISAFVENNLTHSNKQIVNLAFPYYYTTLELIEAIEKVKNKKANFSEINEGDFYQIDFNSTVDHFFKTISAKEYLSKITQKYL